MKKATAVKVPLKKLVGIRPYHSRVAKDIAETEGMEFIFLFIGEVMKYKAARERRMKAKNDRGYSKYMKSIKCDGLLDPVV